MFKFFNKIANSYWYDIVGLIIVIGGCIASGYVTETLSITPAWQSNDWFAHLFPGGLWIGVISIISAVFSLESNRFESRLSNIGNWLGIPSILLTMFVDLMFGNSAAWLTYPLTMIIQIIAVRVWSKTEQYKVSKPLHGFKAVLTLILISLVSLIFSYFTNNIGFDGQHNLIFWTTTFAFAISIVANLAEMVKLSFNNHAWFIYNLFQLCKAIAQMNLANVFKIIYYLFNNVLSMVSWSSKGRELSSDKAID